jgi:HYDIN/CFA65/VesB-like, Ig-like domain
MNRLKLLLYLCCVLLAFGANRAAQFAASVTPTSADFGTQYLNARSASQMFTITNIGSQALTFSSFSIKGSGFRCAQGTAPQTLAPGGSTTVELVFFPTAAGSASGSLALHFPELPQALTASLSGTGAASTASACIVPSTLTSATSRGVLAAWLKSRSAT